MGETPGPKFFNPFSDLEPLSMAILRTGRQPTLIGSYKSHASNKYRTKINLYDSPPDNEGAYCLSIICRMPENKYSERIEGLWWESGDLYLLKTFPHPDFPTGSILRQSQFSKIKGAPENLIEEICRVASIHRVEDTYSMEEAGDLARAGVFGVKIRR